MRLACALLVCAACARGKPPAPILNYHAVGAGPDYFTVSEEAFARQLDFIRSSGLHTISLRDLVEGRDVQRAVVLTFDDGSEDALTRVLPALQKRGMRGTFFIATGLIGKPGFLGWDGVRALAAAGMEIGSHTVTHVHLADLPEKRLRAELADSKRELEEKLKLPVEAIAYPYNSVRRGIRKAAAEAGYRIGVSGVAHGSGDPIDLLRFAINRTTTADDFRGIVLDQRAAEKGGGHGE